MPLHLIGTCIWKARIQQLPSMRKPYCVHFRFPFTDTGKGEDRLGSEKKVQCILNWDEPKETIHAKGELCLDEPQRQVRRSDDFVSLLFSGAKASITVSLCRLPL